MFHVLSNNVLKSNISNFNMLQYTMSIPTPLQSPPLDNYYNILMDPANSENEDDDDKTVITSNESCKHGCDNATITAATLTANDISSDEEMMAHHNLPPEYAIMDRALQHISLYKEQLSKMNAPQATRLKSNCQMGQ